MWLDPDVLHAREGDSAEVFVVRREGRGPARLERMQVRLGETREDGLVRVRSGLAPGDRVVISAEDPLENGLGVEVEE